MQARIYHQQGRNRIRLITLLLAAVFLAVALLVLGSLSPRVLGQGEWWNSAWDFRVLVTVDVAGVARMNKPAEVAINFTNLLNSLDQSGGLIVNSIRVIEVTEAGQLVDDTVSFQFDPGSNFNANTNAHGSLIFLMTGQTNAAATRYYHVYFDTSGSFAPSVVIPRVTVTDNVQDQGFDSYRIATENATYFYHKQGGGFSGLEDVNGNDWIDWNNSPGAAGDFRGIPNLVHPADGGFFHPGRTSASSTLLSTGPLKATFKSTSNDGDWEVMWELFPDYARMTVLKTATGKNYWFLYEGTPGGVLEGDQDFVVRSDGSQNLASASWTGDLADEEWAFVADPNVGRAIYLIHHSEDNVVDSYKPDNDLLMAIFGFGRDGNSRNLSQVPKQFTIGLVDATILGGVSPVVDNAYKPLNLSLGAAEERPSPTPTSTSTLSPTPADTPTVGPSPTPSSFIFLPVAADIEQ